jgi:hypothetical protein
MTPRPCDLPSPRELAHAPELGGLAVLDTVLVAVQLALVAAEPALDHDPRFRPVHDRFLSPRYHLACNVIALIGALRTAIGCYRQAVSDEYYDKLDEIGDLPF